MWWMSFSVISGFLVVFFFFFFNDTATTEIYTLSLHDALPISERDAGCAHAEVNQRQTASMLRSMRRSGTRSEEHTSELQSRLHLVCRLLLEKKKKKKAKYSSTLSTSMHLPYSHNHSPLLIEYT